MMQGPRAASSLDCAAHRQVKSLAWQLTLWAADSRHGRAHLGSWLTSEGRSVDDAEAADAAEVELPPVDAAVPEAAAALPARKSGMDTLENLIVVVIFRKWKKKVSEDEKDEKDVGRQRINECARIREIPVLPGFMLGPSCEAVVGVVGEGTIQSPAETTERIVQRQTRSNKISRSRSERKRKDVDNGSSKMNGARNTQAVNVSSFLMRTPLTRRYDVSST